MNGKRSQWQLLFFLVGVLLLSGCSAKHKMVPAAPDWVNQGSGAFTHDETMLFYGVGAVSGISSQTLAMQSADQRARADIARQIATFVNEIYRDYQATATASPQAPVEQHIDNTLETLTRVTVRGATIIDHWRDPDKGTLFALARLDLKQATVALKQEDEIDPKLKKFVIDNAEKTFARLKHN